MSFQSNILNFPVRPVAPTVVAQSGGDTAPLRRPSTLIRAARAGLALWQRERDLRRALGQGETPAPGTALARLLVLEEAANEARLAAGADYDPRRHVLLLVAILAERRAAAGTPARGAAGPVTA